MFKKIIARIKSEMFDWKIYKEELKKIDEQIDKATKEKIAKNREQYEKEVGAVNKFFGTNHKP